MRQAFTMLHRYVGLAIAGFLLMAALTGSIIVFERELDAALNPDLFKARATDARPIAIDRLIAMVENEERRVVAVEMPLAGASAIFRVAARDAVRPLAYDQLFVDPGTGEVLGRRLWGTCCLARQQILPFLVHFHYSLHLPGNIGLTLMGIVGLLWFLDSFTGLVLAWPRGQRMLAGWKRTLSIKRGARGYRLHLDLHRAGGVWLWSLLVVMAFTSVGVSLEEEIVQPLVKRVSPLSPSVFEQPAPPRPGKGNLTFENAIARAEAVARGVMHHPRAAYVAHQSGLSMFAVAVAETGIDPRNGLGPSWFYIDDRDGSMRSTAIMASGTPGDVFLQAQLPTHTGRIGWLPGRILVALFGLAVAALTITGLLIWNKKRQARLKPAPARSRI